ncbi:efflux RND transporter periplasmic adaptor subunit [bacterium]|nr:efflux RND transporter periplasmic adaptor subunit [bacterium]
MNRWLLPVLLALALPTFAQQAPRPVVSEIVTADPTRQRSFTGVIAAETSTVLAFQTAGRIATLPVSAGDRVKAGQVLATLDQITLQEDVDAAEAALTAARTAADVAAQSLTRAQELARRGVASTETLQNAQRGSDAAAAQVQSAAAGLARARDAAGFGTLTAPNDGVVLSVQGQAGAVVSAGTPVLTLASLTGREAVLDVPAEFLSLLSPGQKFTLRARMPNAPTLTGTLRLIEPVADASTRSRRIRVTLPEAPEIYRIGALISAELAATPAPVMTVPAAAITGTDQAPMVWRIAPGERTAHQVAVTLGGRLGDRVIITSGVAPGDEVAVKGVHSLTEGQVLGERIAG